MNTPVQDIEQALGKSPKRVTPLSGGCIGDVYRVDLDDPDAAPVVMKADHGPEAKLDIEAWMLRYLSENSRLPVPAVRFSTPQVLIMDFLPGTSRFSARAEEHAAELIADLHANTWKRYGLARDTLIGGLHQPNTPADRWLDFFARHRIVHMAQKGFAEGSVPRDMLARLERFAERVDQWLTEPEQPSLLHGDAWTTNMLAEGDRMTGFLDPAIYYGHPEIELAFTTMFNTFGESFFRRYHEIRPLEDIDGFFELRRDLYNLYPLLVHVRLFGGGYLGGIDATLRRIGC